jgi:hypothetical protein
MKNELERTWKEAMLYLFAAGTKEIQKKKLSGQQTSRLGFEPDTYLEHY